MVFKKHIGPIGRIGPIAMLALLTTATVLRAAEPVAPPPAPVASVIPAMRNDWVQLHDEMVADAKARAGQIQIVLIGDSITRRWTTGAGAKLYATRYAPHGAINLGISADGTQHVLWRLQHGVLDPLHPKMALIMIGTNNLGRSDPPAVANGVWAIVAHIRQTHPETRVLVVGIFPRAQANLNAKIPEVNKLLAKLDDGRMVKYIDFGEQFLLTDGTLNLKIFTDGTHPEHPDGFQIWADAMQPTVDEWLKTPAVADVPPPAIPAASVTDLVPVTPDSRNDWLYHHKNYVNQAAKGNCDLLFIGDAVMSCWSRPEGLFKKEYGKYRALNFSIFGNRTENILYQLANGELDGIKPRLVVVQVQENVMDATLAADVVAGMAAIAKLIREKQPETKVLLLGAFPVGETPKHGLRTKVAEYNAGLAGVADNKSVFFFDPGKAFLPADGILARGATPSQNPYNAKAYEKWADVQRDTIAALMTPTPAEE